VRSSFVGLVFAVLVVATATAVGTPPTVATDRTIQNSSDPGPGVRLTGTVGVERAAVDDRTAVARLDARLAAAESDAARAAILDERLTTNKERIDALEAQATDVTTDDTGATAQAAVLAAEARAVDSVLVRIETTAAALAVKEREQYDLKSRTVALRERTNTLSNRFETQTAVIDGARVENTTADRADVVAAYERALSDSGQVQTLFGNERIVVQVREGDGSTAIYSLQTEDGNVVAATNGALEEPTVRVAVEGAVIQHLARTDSPGAVFDAARDRSALTYEGIGLGNQVKFGVAAVAEETTDLVSG
jgi:hypothetical protein